MNSEGSLFEENMEENEEVMDQTAKLYSAIELLFAQDDLEAAIVLLSQVIELQGWRSVPYYDRGLCKQRLGQFAMAISDYTQALLNRRSCLGADSADTFNNRGMCWRELQKPERALSDYAEAIRLAPHDAKAFHNRGILHSEMGNEEEAIADYSKSIEVDSQNAHVFFNRALSWIQLRKYEEALGDLNRSIDLDPTDPDAFFCRCRINRRLGKRKEAASDRRQAKLIEDLIQQCSVGASS